MKESDIVPFSMMMNYITNVLGIEKSCVFNIMKPGRSKKILHLQKLTELYHVVYDLDKRTDTNIDLVRYYASLKHKELNGKTVLKAIKNNMFKEVVDVTEKLFEVEGNKQ